MPMDFSPHSNINENINLYNKKFIYFFQIDWKVFEFFFIILNSFYAGNWTINDLSYNFDLKYTSLVYFQWFAQWLLAAETTIIRRSSMVQLLQNYVDVRVITHIEYSGQLLGASVTMRLVMTGPCKGFFSLFAFALLFWCWLDLCAVFRVCTNETWIFLYKRTVYFNKGRIGIYLWKYLFLITKLLAKLFEIS